MTDPPHPLKRWRKQHRLTQTILAERVGMAQQEISNIEHYRLIPRNEDLEALRRESGLPTDAFVRPERFLEEHPTFFSGED